MAKFDSKSFNPQAFGKYVDRIPNVTKNELAKSGAVGTNQNAHDALANQTGSLYARVPYFGRIDGSTSQNNDGGTDITSTSTTTYEQAIQKAGGDNKNIFKLVIMHSEVATNLENMKLLKYMTYTDADGIERELALATWNGRTVLVDDNMPTEDVANQVQQS